MRQPMVMQISFPGLDDLIRKIQELVTAVIAGFWTLIYSSVYYAIQNFAFVHWFVIRIMLGVGFTIQSLNRSLTAYFFAPLIQQTSSQMRYAVGLTWVVALFILGITYLMGAFFRAKMVHPKSVFIWYIAALIFFQVGPSVYAEMNTLRGTIQGAFYASSLTALSGISVPQMQNTGNGAAALGMSPLCDNFGPYLGVAAPVNYFSGLDIALAYLSADGRDTMGFIAPGGGGECASSSGFNLSLPRSWYEPGSFFDILKAPTPLPGNPFEQLTTEQQIAVVKDAFAGEARLLYATPLVIFGLVEQLVALCLGIAQGLTFISFSVALLFAFFKRTEPIAWAIIDQWIGLLVQTVIIAVIQSMVVGFCVVAAMSGNAPLVLAATVIGVVLIGLLLKSALSAIWKAFNGLFEAFSQATGSVMGTPGQVVAGAAGTAGMLTGGVIGGGVALASGASGMQAFGVAAGQSSSLVGAARMLTRIGSDTHYGEMAQEFSEGAAFRQIGDAVAGKVAGPPVGGFLAGRLLGEPRKRKNEIKGEMPNSEQKEDTFGGEENPRSSAPSSASPNPPAPSGSGVMLRRTTIPMPAVPYEREEEIVDAEIITDELSGGGIRLPVPMGSFSPALGAPLLMLESSEEKTMSEEQALDVPRSPTDGSGNALMLPDRAMSASETDLDDVTQQITENDQAREETAMREGIQSTIHEASTDPVDSFDKLALSNAAGQLSSAAEGLNRAALKQDANLRQQHLEQRLARTEGAFSVQGADNIAAVLANTLIGIRADRATSPDLTFDNSALAKRITQATGTELLDNRIPMSGGDMARYGLFMNKALEMNLTGNDATQLIQEVKSSPDAGFSQPIRTEITARLVGSGGHSARSAEAALDELEHLTRMLPDTLTVYGSRIVVVDEEGSLSAPTDEEKQ